MPTGHRCVVCKTYRYSKNIGQGISFHKFPKDEVLSGKWCLALKLIDFQPEKESYICSKHFKFSDFDNSPLDRGKQRVKRMLIKGTVPSLYPSGKSSVPSQSQKELHTLAHEDMPTSTAPVTLPIAIRHEINVTQLPQSQPPNTSRGVEDDPLAIVANGVETQTMEEQPPEKKHDISIEEVEKEKKKRIANLSCGVCKYQAKSEEDLKQHLFEEIRQLQVSKAPNVQDVDEGKCKDKPDLPDKDQKQSKTGKNVTENAMPSENKAIIRCTECKYESKSKGDSNKIIFQDHQVHKFQRKPINKTDDEQECKKSETRNDSSTRKKAIPPCGLCNYQAKSEDDLRQHLFEEIRQQRLKKSKKEQGNQADERHKNCSNFFIDMASMQDGAIVPHCGCSE